jgi:hypothetical protein
MLLRFQTEKQLEFFRGLFGSTSTYSLRRRAPKLGCPNFLRKNDIINIVLNEKQNIPEELRMRTTDGGVDLQFDSFMLVITVW